MNDNQVQKRCATYVIVGKPIPWARPGRTKWSTTTYDTQRAEKEEYGWHFKIAHGNDPLFSGPIGIDMVFYMPVTGTLKKLRMQALGEPHYTRPDIDNLAKFCLDAATGILYTDDSIIADMHVKKIFAEQPRTELTIREL